MGCDVEDTDVISASLYPKVCEDFINFRNTYGPVELLSTRIFLEGPKVGDEFEVSPLSLHPVIQTILFSGRTRERKDVAHQSTGSF